MLDKKSLKVLLEKVFYDKWLPDLMDVTARNKLINSRDNSETSAANVIPLFDEDLDAILDMLDSTSSQKTIKIESIEPNVLEGLGEEVKFELKDFHTIMSYEALIRAAERIRAANNTKVLEKGIWSTYVALGFLKWKRPKDSTTVNSPLIMVPVKLIIKNNTVRVTTNSNEDIKINHALPVALQHSYNSLNFEYSKFFKDLTDIDNVSDALSEIDSWLQENARKTPHMKDWSVERKAMIVNVASDAELIYYDLRSNIDAALSKQTVESFAKLFIKNDSTLDEFEATQVDHAVITNKENIYENFNNSETPPLIFPADSSQTKAISACLRNPNMNFIIQGPPGTGKSQTIANLIAAYIYEGKKVLFVSEKAAAIDVVKNRLNDAGLEKIFLNLHSPLTKTALKNEFKVMLQSLRHHKRENIKPPKNNAWHKYVGREKEARDFLYYTHPTTGKEIQFMIGELLNGFITTSISKRYGINIDKEKLPSTLVDMDIKLTRDDWVEVEKAIEELAVHWYTVNNDETYHWQNFKELDFGLASKKISDLKEALTELVKLLEVIPNAKLLFDFNNLNDIEKLETIMSGLASIEIDFIIKNPKSIFEKETVEQIKAKLTELSELQEQWTSNITILKEYEWCDTDKVNLEFDLTEYNNKLKPSQPIGGQLKAKKQEISDDLKIIEDLAKFFMEKFNINTAKFTNKHFELLEELISLDSSTIQDYFSQKDNLNNKTEIEEEASKIIDEMTKLFEMKKELEAHFHLTTLESFSEEEILSSLEAYKNTDKKPGMFSQKALKELWQEREKISKVFKNPKDKTNNTRWNDIIAYDKQIKLMQGIISNNTFLNSEVFKTTIPIYEEIKTLTNILQTAQKILDELKNTETIETIIRQLPALKNSIETLIQQLLKPEIQNTVKSKVENIQAIKDMLEGDTTLISKHKGLTIINSELTELEKYLAATTIGDNTAITLKNLHKLHEDIKKYRQETERINKQIIEYNSFMLDKQLPVVSQKYDVQDKQNHIIHMQELISKAAKIAEAEIIHQNSTREEIEAALKLQETEKEILEKTSKIKQGVTWIQTSFEETSKTQTHLTKATVRELLGTLGHMETNADVTVWKKYQKALQVLERKGLISLINHIFEHNIIFTPEDSTNHNLTTAAYFEVWCKTVIYEILIRQYMGSNGMPSTENMSQKELLQILKEEKEILAQGEKILLTKHINNIIEKQEDEVFKHSMSKTKEYLNKSMSVKDRIQLGLPFLLALKPCIMMSPKTVSELLPNKTDMFDVVIYDEASQITIPRVINSMYRAKQIIIVGDDLQMPPSNFFGISSQEVEELESTKDFQSIMDAANSSPLFNNDFALTVHYRSQHESLIWFSRNHFYKNMAGISLDIPPSSFKESEEFGIKWVPTPKNSYVPSESGKFNGGYNTNEAQIVAEAIIEHFSEGKEETLGVIAFSQKQQNKIEEELNTLLINSGRTHLKNKIDASKEDRLEGLFIKNIENIQGDERDIIFMSVGYGTDSEGNLKQFFGPINQKEGHRRLNVAITRAKRKLVVFSSMQGKDITAPSDGAKYFSRFLSYAENPHEQQITIQNTQKADSPFEEEVGNFIESLGYKIERQTGVGSFKIDIAVFSNNSQGEPSHHYGLGVECDGASYHSSDEARTRDITRQEILESKGWHIYRIWSTDWFTRRTQEEEKLKKELRKHCGPANTEDSTFPKIPKEPDPYDDEEGLMGISVRTRNPNSGGDTSAALKQQTAMDRGIML